MRVSRHLRGSRGHYPFDITAEESCEIEVMTTKAIEKVVDRPWWVLSECPASLIRSQRPKLGTLCNRERPPIRLGKTLHKADHDVATSFRSSLLQRETVLDCLCGRLFDEDVEPRLEAVDRNGGLDPRVHRHDHPIKVFLLKHLSVIRIDARNAEIARTPVRALLIDVAARDQVPNRTALRQVTNRSTKNLRRVMHREPEARVEVLNGMAAATDDPDACQARHSGSLASDRAACSSATALLQCQSSLTAENDSQHIRSHKPRFNLGANRAGRT